LLFENSTSEISEPPAPLTRIAAEFMPFQGYFSRWRNRPKAFILPSDNRILSPEF